MARKGLGKGLDSLIPDFYNEDFDSNSTQSLEDMLNEKNGDEEEAKPKVEEKIVEEEVSEKVEEKDDKRGSKVSDRDGDGEEIQEEEFADVGDTSEELHSDNSSKETVRATPKIQVKQEHIDEVKQIVDKNPRITLWSSRSAAVFRYLRKTEPEFSISKEASVLIDEAVAKKYPEIWDLFDEY